MLRPSLLVLVLSASAAAAETLMNPGDFETWSAGKTLDYFVNGSLWGSEMHLDGRKTVDADVGGTCRSGHWYPQDNAICFVYDLSPGPYCWHFWRDGEQVIARYADQPDGETITVTLSDAPVPCTPGVGV